MNGANYFIFYYSSSRRKYSIYIFKAAHEGDEWNSNWRENTEEENYKNYLVCERHYPEYQFIKSLHKIITSLFVQKSLKVSQTESF